MLAQNKVRSMPAKDFYHEHVKNALINDGWKITHDPLRLESELTDLYSALGQFLLYRKALAKKEPERKLFLAIREAVYLDVFVHPDNQELCASEQIRLLVFNPDTQEIVRWIE
jgi:hypothetical protein